MAGHASPTSGTEGFQLPLAGAMQPCRATAERSGDPAEATRSEELARVADPFAAPWSHHTKTSPKVVVVALVGDIRASA
jgi:hypothetical protein